ncbi:MAG: (2Fe-2S)-binding protein [Acidimicrobiia bacterium]|nr:(2Fe-2S)-binding protein [Acidimicrobiia bacterium]
MKVGVQINERELELEVATNSTLIDLLREDLGLRGTVEGCGVGVCGSCTVLVDGRPVSSCLVLAADVDGRVVTTIEGLGRNGALDPVQRHSRTSGSFQCGYCTAGMIMAVKGLLAENPRPSAAEAKDYLSGNICRCGTYEEVLGAVATAAASSDGGGD